MTLLATNLNVWNSPKYLIKKIELISNHEYKTDTLVQATMYGKIFYYPERSHKDQAKI